MLRSVSKISLLASLLLANPAAMANEPVQIDVRLEPLEREESLQLEDIVGEELADIISNFGVANDSFYGDSLIYGFINW